MIKLRPYQEQAIRLLRDGLASGQLKPHPVYVRAEPGPRPRRVVTFRRVKCKPPVFVVEVRDV